MRLDEIKDKPVISIAEGKKLGEVQDALLDGSYLQVAALVIGGGGLFGGPKQAVEYNSVRGIGPDAIMVSARDAVAEITDTSPLAALHRVTDIGQDVMSESGVRLGKLDGAAFDPQSGAVTALTLAPDDNSPLAGAGDYDVPRSQVLSITDKIVVVQHEVLQQSGAATASAPPSSGMILGQPPGLATSPPAVRRNGEGS
jgi:sporulation protein YlmC with PRC-barrel domain